MDAAQAALLGCCITQAKRDGLPVDAGALPAEAIAALAQAMADADPQAATELALDCAACGHQWNEVFDAGHFLLHALDDWAQRLLDQVHVLAKAYGWTGAGMRNYLSILAQRAIGTPALRPRPRSRFEEGLGAEPPNREQAVAGGQHAEAAVSVRPAAPDLPQSPLQHTPVLPAAQVHHAALPAPHPAMTAAALAPLQALRESVQLPRAEPAPPAQAITHIEGLPRLAAAMAVSLAGVAAARADAPRTPEAPPPVAAPAVQPPLAQDDAMRQQRPALETVTRLLMPAPIGGTAPPGDAGQGGGRHAAAAAEAAPAAIEIHIGRIEVHADGAAAARTPAPQPAQAPATTSLDDYLRERSGRGGRV
jgi:hypothetical protein